MFKKYDNVNLVYDKFFLRGGGNLDRGGLVRRGSYINKLVIIITDKFNMKLFFTVNNVSYLKSQLPIR